MKGMTMSDIGIMRTVEELMILSESDPIQAGIRLSWIYPSMEIQTVKDILDGVQDWHIAEGQLILE